jgi:hypothetical protein
MNYVVVFRSSNALPITDVKQCEVSVSQWNYENINALIGVRVKAAQATLRTANFRFQLTASSLSILP